MGELVWDSPSPTRFVAVNERTHLSREASLEEGAIFSVGLARTRSSRSARKPALGPHANSEAATPLADLSPTRTRFSLLTMNASVRDLTSRFSSKLGFQVVAAAKWRRGHTARATSSAISHHTGCDYAECDGWTVFKETERAILHWRRSR